MGKHTAPTRREVRQAEVDAAVKCHPAGSRVTAPMTAIEAAPADGVVPTPATELSVIRRSSPWVGASAVAAGVIAAGVVMGPSADIATAAAVSPAETTGSIPRVDAAKLDSGPVTPPQETAQLKALAREVAAQEKARHEAEVSRALRDAQEAADQARRVQEALAARQAAQASPSRGSSAPSTASQPAGATGTSRSAPAATEATATPTPATSTPATSAAPVAASSVGARVVAFAMAQRGKPYVWGAVGPSSYDCSGLVLAAYKSAGITLPRTSGAQAGAGRAITRAQLQPGDLVFYYAPISHVAIYIGNGQVVQAATEGIPIGVMSLTWGGQPTAYRHIA